MKWRAALLLVPLLAPSALAASASFDLARAGGIDLQGAVVAELPGGSVHVDHPRPLGAWEARGATGVLSIYTWSVARTQAGNVDGAWPASRIEQEDMTLENATLLLTFGAQDFTLDLVAKDDLRVRGWTAASGLPVFLAHAVERTASSAPLTAKDVDWRWEEGWPFLGHFFTASGELDGFPSFPDPTLEASGDVLFKLHGARLRFVDAEGRSRDVQTGERQEAGDPRAGTQTWTRAIFEGRVDHFALPLGDRWGAAAPALSWTVEGTSTWRNAEGRVRVGDRELHVADSLVLDGAIGTSATRGALLATGRHAGSADATRIQVDGVDVDLDRQEFPLAPAAGVSLLALVAAWFAQGLVGRALGSFYTRILPTQAALHPRRAALLARVQAAPGIHLRELFRELGGAWGAYLFHLRVLERAGYLTLHRQGRYRCAYPAGARPPPDVSPHALRLLDALPEDGTERSLRELAERLGITRQLAAHHARTLEAAGLARGRREGRARRLARAPATKADAPTKASSGAS